MDEKTQKINNKNYTTVNPKQLHKSHIKFWRQAQSTDTAFQKETSWDGRHFPKGGPCIADEEKLGGKTGDKRKPRPARRAAFSADWCALPALALWSACVMRALTSACSAAGASILSSKRSPRNASSTVFSYRTIL